MQNVIGVIGGLVMLMIVRQSDIEMMGIGLDSDPMVVTVLIQKPHGCG